MLKIYISIAVVCVIFVSGNLFSEKIVHKMKDDVIILTSIPKLGSHLAEIFISMLTRKKVLSLHVNRENGKFLTGKGWRKSIKKILKKGLEIC